MGCGFEFSDPGIPAPPLQVATEPVPEHPYPIRFQVPSSPPPSRATNWTRLIVAFPFHVGPLAVVIVALVVAADSWHTRVAAWLGLVLLILSLPVVVPWLLAMALSLVVAVPTWLAALLLGRVPAPLHRFQAAVLRYVTRTSAYLCMSGGRWPPFPWQGADAYPRVEIDPPAPRSRLRTLFVLPLAVPAMITAVFFGVVVWMLGVGAWISVAATGRLPSTIQEMLDLSIGFQCRTLGYFPLLLTDVYPWYESGPLMLASRRADDSGARQREGVPGTIEPRS